MRDKIYVALIHYPVYNKNDEIVATSVTNFDIHDISRTCTTYDIDKYFIIHPAQSQHDIIEDILKYWQHGYGSTANPDRNRALEIVQLVDDISAAVDYIEKDTGYRPYVLTTDARTYPNTISYMYARKNLLQSERPVLLLFGTGWGIQNEVMQAFDYILEPIYGVGEYNHLCVRSAVAIILDRLLGSSWWQEDDN